MESDGSKYEAGEPSDANYEDGAIVQAWIWADTNKIQFACN
jgi:hypothetical protein